MNTDHKPFAACRPLCRRTVGSLMGSSASAFVGWLTMNVLWALCAMMGMSREPFSGLHVYIAITSAFFVVTTWLIVLLPLYLLVPLKSIIWRRTVCTICGALAGGLILAVISQFSIALVEYIFWAAVTGAVTCFFGSSTVKYFRGSEQA